jgi:hypothetical protein
VTASVTKMAQVFIDDVARNRGVTSEYVESKYGKGDVLLGQDAANAGLIDGLSSLEDTIAFISTGGNMMAQKELAAKASVKSMKCDGCAKAFDDEDEDDDVYCSSCYKSSSKASFVAQAFAALGCQDKDAAIGALLGLKAQAAENEELKCKLAALEQEKTINETKHLIDEAIADGRIAASKRGEYEEFAKTYNHAALKAFIGTLSKSAMPVLPPSGPNEPTVATAASHKFSAEQLKILAATGVTPEEWLAQKANYQRFINPEEK